ncbi:hypothetical protein BH09VER1_BH09VER1_37240 [soil metagenome]
MKAASRDLWRQAAGAIPWGVFFVLAPLDLLIVGIVVWLPLLIWREWARSKRYGRQPGGVIRFGIVVVLIALAILAPTKYADRRVGPLVSPSPTLAELRAAQIISLKDDKFGEARISLSSTNPTRRDVMRAIEKQTCLGTWYMSCGNGATFLFGGGGGPISVRQRPSEANPAR